MHADVGLKKSRQLDVRGKTKMLHWMAVIMQLLKKAKINQDKALTCALGAFEVSSLDEVQLADESLPCSCCSA